MVLPKGEGPRPPTIYDVARTAGVSHQTVSRHLRGLSGVGRATGERIDAAVSQLGYRPNSVARALATNRSRRIGAVVFGLSEWGPAQIVKGAAEAARRAGYLLDFITLDDGDHEAVGAALETLRSQDLAGVFAVGPTDLVRAELATGSFTIPVYLEVEESDELSDEPRSLNGRGAQLAVEALLNAGHRSIGHIGGPAGWSSSANREFAYWRTMNRHGLPTFPVVRGDWSARSGYQAGLAWPRDLKVTALFVANDQMALGVLRALNERGMRVPDDISVVGFDDIAEAEFMLPPLSTVRLDFVDQGRRRIGALIDLIEGRDVQASAHGGIVEFVSRDSVAGPAT